MVIPVNRERQLFVNKAIMSSMVIATRTQTLLFQVNSERQRAVQFHTQVSWCRLELQPVAIHGDVDLAVSFPVV